MWSHRPSVRSPLVGAAFSLGIRAVRLGVQIALFFHLVSKDSPKNPGSREVKGQEKWQRNNWTVGLNHRANRRGVRRRALGFRSRRVWHFKRFVPSLSLLLRKVKASDAPFISYYILHSNGCLLAVTERSEQYWMRRLKWINPNKTTALWSRMSIHMEMTAMMGAQHHWPPRGAIVAASQLMQNTPGSWASSHISGHLQERGRKAAKIRTPETGIFELPG